MSVWIVSYNGEIIKIFSSKEKAKQFIQKGFRFDNSFSESDFYMIKEGIVE